uniref:SUI1 domain-containing protein n=1 Tax=Strongyloides stercoralis TaxID=6248 RepID=A0A0K0EI42_STRER
MDLFWFTQPCVIKGNRIAKNKEIINFKKLLGDDTWNKLISNSKLEIVKMKSAVKKDIDVLMCDSKPIFFKDGKINNNDWFLSLHIGLILPRFYNPIVLSSTRWKMIEKNGIITKEDVFNGEKPFENYPPYDNSKVSFVYCWNKVSNWIIGPVGVAIPTQVLHNFNERIYPTKSVGVVTMTRGKDHFCNSLQVKEYKIDTFLSIDNNLDNVENENTNDTTSNTCNEDTTEGILIQNEDEKLHVCFLTALKYLLKDSTLLPMDLGYFFQQYVQKCVPDNEKIDLKKTTYSKLSKYVEKLNEKSSEGKVVNIINVKDKITIKSINFQNKIVSDFEPIYGIPDENNDKQVKTKFSISTCFLSTKSFRALFSGVDSNVENNDIPYNFNELKDLLLKYLKMNNISIENEKVIMNEVLRQFLNVKDNTLTTPQTIKSIVLLIQQKCKPGYVMKKPDNSITVKKGPIPNLIVHSEKASSKEITVIRNLELFDLLNDSFVSSLKHFYATSAGIHEGKKRCAGKIVVQLQGNQLKSIKKFFKENYGLEERYIKIE